jgi:TRAP-type C4-dicarboxylate transport system permease small subunit
MVGFFLRLSDNVDRVVKVVAVPVCIFFVGVVFMGVVSRYVVRAPIISSVELSRIGFIWSTFLGAAICVKRESHIKLMFLFERMPLVVQDTLQVTLSILMAWFFGFLTFKGVQLLDAVSGTFFPASGISQIWMFAALPIGSLAMFIHALTFIIRDVSRLFSRKDNVQTIYPH